MEYKNISAAIVIPTYNEVDNLPRLLEQVLSLRPARFAVLVVDDNSADGTGKLADSLTSQYPGQLEVMHRAGKLGLGSAYIQGFQHLLKTGVPAIGQMDADFSHDPAMLPKMLAALEQHDIAVGSRYVPGGALDEKWALWRKGLSAFGNFYSRTILNLPLKDVTGGFRVWRRTALERMPLTRVRSNGYVFQVEMAYVAHRLGLRFSELPIYFAERTAGLSKMSIRIQMEAALRVWALPSMYRDLSR